jgi:hypothetical protein
MKYTPFVVRKQNKLSQICLLFKYNTHSTIYAILKLSRADLDKLEYVISTSTRFECQHSPVIATMCRSISYGGS